MLDDCALILCVRFNGHYPGEPGLPASTRMSLFWILLELRMTEMMVTTGAINRAKLQSNCHHQQTNTQFFTGQMSFLSPNQQCQSTEGNECALIDRWIFVNVFFILAVVALV